MGVKMALLRAHLGQKGGLQVAQTAEQSRRMVTRGPRSPECTRTPPEGGRVEGTRDLAALALQLTESLVIFNSEC